MKKNIALFGALAIVGFSAAPAHALFFDSIFGKIAAVAKTAVGKVAAGVKQVAGKVIAQGASLASKAVDAARSAADNALNQLAGAAKGLLAKGQAAAAQALTHAGDFLKKNLPGSLGKYVDAGVQLGNGGLAKLNGAINTNIDRALAFGHSKVAALGAKGQDFVKATASSIKGHVNQAVNHARGIVNGKIAVGKGRVTAMFNKGASTLLSHATKFLAPVKGRK